MEALRESDAYAGVDAEAQARMALEEIEALSAEGLVDRGSVLHDAEAGAVTYSLASGILCCEDVGVFGQGLEGAVGEAPPVQASLAAPAVPARTASPGRPLGPAADALVLYALNHGGPPDAYSAGSSTASSADGRRQGCGTTATRASRSTTWPASRAMASSTC
jgi:hypothetical protein